MKAEQEHTRRWMDLSRALDLSPDDPAIAKTYQPISGHYGLKPDQSLADLERLDRTARAQIAAARADGVRVPASVFAGLPAGRLAVRYRRSAAAAAATNGFQG